MWHVYTYDARKTRCRMQSSTRPGDHFTVFSLLLHVLVSLLLPDVGRHTAALRPSVAHAVRLSVYKIIIVCQLSLAVAHKSQSVSK